MVVNYLKKRLGIKKVDARPMVPLATEAVKEYLLEVDDEGLNFSDLIDNFDIKYRLEKPYVFGFFAKHVFESDLPDKIKHIVAVEAFDSIDLEDDKERDFAIPAFLITIISMNLKHGESMRREYLDAILVSYGYQPDVLRAHNYDDTENVLNEILRSPDLAEAEKTTVFGILLSRTISDPDEAKRFYSVFLNSKVSGSEKRKICSTFVDTRYAGRFWKDRLRKAGLFEARDIAIDGVVAPTLMRESLDWLKREISNKEELINVYLRANPRHPASVSKYQAALLMTKAFNDELSKRYVRSVVNKVIEFPDARIKFQGYRLGFDLFGESYKKKAASETDARILKWTNG